ncbi:MAG: hypothetical protein C5B55_00940 [Blastocatellia bacterium]|nr:MAG: hypothetical protein C5B55_00940 [Blastocatellia bacterium]
MANVLILGGGFSGVVAAERLAQSLAEEHQITLVSRDRSFVFYPGLVDVAFGKSEPSDVSFDLRDAMLDRRIRFIQGEVARIEPDANKVLMARGEVEGVLTYDYLLFALGRRLATEEVPGFFEYAHHLLTIDSAVEFGAAIKSFSGGRAVIGQCCGARLPVPVYETAFALARLLESRSERPRVTIVSPDPPGYQLGDSAIAHALRTTLEDHSIEFLSEFPVERVTPETLISKNGHNINYRLLMLVPPFRGSAVSRTLQPTVGNEGYLNVDNTMRVQKCDRVYAAGDCVNFTGPKMAHMAVHQAEVAAANLALEIAGREPSVTYSHELMMVIDEGGPGTLFIRQDLSESDGATVKQGRFWSWAKWIHDKYWQARHS